MNQMKCSYSMSSLESPQKYLRTPEGAKKPVISVLSRNAYTLSSKKPRRTLEKKMWRRSWGSTEEANPEELWKAYQKCTQELKEADKGEEVDLRDFLEDYTTLCGWLNAVQVQRGTFADVDKLSELGDELLKKQPWRVKINDTAKCLLKNYPKLKEEFQWRVKHLNSQWDALEKILRCQNSSNLSDAILKDNGDEAGGIEWLREWLKEMESKLQPLDFRVQWTSEHLQEQILRHKDLEDEIEKNSSKVHLSLREFGGGEWNNTKRSRLETRWLQLRLRVLEWVQHLSGVQQRLKYRNQGTKSDNYIRSIYYESSEGENNEPKSKYPRLGEAAVFESNLEGVKSQDQLQIVPQRQELNEPQERIKERRVVVGSSSSSFSYSSNSELEEGQRLVPCVRRKKKKVRRSKVLSHSGVSALDTGDKVSVGVGRANESRVDVMGQSHDSESVFNQSGSPVPNSVVEFIFDESHSNIGLKRKLSPPSEKGVQGPTSLSPKEINDQEFMSEGIPRNISTYYFKHSDTESELNNHSQHNKNALKSPPHPEDYEGPNEIVLVTRRVLKTSDKSNWQNSGLDYSQKFEFGLESSSSASTSRRTSAGSGSGDKISGDEISLDSEGDEHHHQRPPQHFVFDKEDEVMMDLEEDSPSKRCSGGGGGGGIRISGGSGSGNGNKVLDEIGELVEQAELLVKRRSRGLSLNKDEASCCKNTPGPGSPNDEQDKKRIGDEWQKIVGKNINGNASSTLSLAESSSAKRSCKGSREGICNVGGGCGRKISLGCTTSGSSATNLLKCSKWASGGGLSSMDHSNVSTGAELSAAGGGVAKNSKKSSRVRQWVRAHNSNSESFKNQKNTSSCDASAESTSESESSCPESEAPLSSDDPTTLSTSTYLLQQTQAALAESSTRKNPLSSNCSSSNNVHPHHTSISGSKEPSGVLQSGCGSVIFRQKKRTLYGKQRPKSFTDTLAGSTSNSQTAGSSTWLSSSQNCFVSDTALNLLGSRSGGGCGAGSGSWSSSNGSGGGSPGHSNSESRVKKGHRSRRRLFKSKRKSVEDVTERDEACGGFLRSTSFVESTSFNVPADQEGPLSSSPSNKENAEEFHPKPQFQILGPVSSAAQASYVRTNSDNGSLNTDGLHEQDWDSYQEKYLSEPYSEEPYDPDGTLKLLAFGEDYGQYLERGDSESSSVLSGFEPNPRKKRPLVLANQRNSEMPESDSDREELNHLLSQSAAQLRFIDAVFRKQLSAGNESNESPAEYAEMEATCDENISSLKLILSNISKCESLPFEVDTKTLESLLEKWHILKERIRQAARLNQIREEMDDLKSDFSSVQSHFEEVDPFNASDLLSLQHKIGYIQEMLSDLTQRKQKLQSLNEASLGTQLFLKDTDAGGVIKEQLQQLYALYEENFQLGSYLLEKMRFLQEAWEKFESEKSSFERSISVCNLRSKLRKELSSAASTDSGHGTDVSHDSSISDNDMDFQERHKKLDDLKKRAFEIKAFLPPGSPVMDVIEQRVFEAEKGLEDLQKTSEIEKPLDLKIIYPKKRSPLPNRRSITSTLKGIRLTKNSPSLTTPYTPNEFDKPTRRWKVVRRMVIFNFALMGLFLAAAYFLHPKCCEFSNTFCFSLVPHLTHETMPPI